MRVDHYIAALRALPVATLAAVTGGHPILVLSPHPDDETLGCGGLLAAATQAGIEAHVLVLTDGAASHPNSVSYPAARLTALRRDETRRALACLGLPEQRLHTLDLPDAAAPTEGPAFERAAVDIATLAASIAARTLFVTWGRDPHCDHAAAATMARTVASRLGLRLLAYPIWGLHLPNDMELDLKLDEAPPRGMRFDITEQLELKRAAIACYASQLTDLIDDDPAAFRLTAEQLAPFLEAAEIFIEVLP